MGKQSHLPFALEGKAASPHALQGYSHSCPAELSKCAKHDAGRCGLCSPADQRQCSTEIDLHLQ